MRSLTYFVGVSLDGFIAGPDGSFDMFPVEGDHQQTLLHEYGDTIPTHVQQALDLTPPRTHFDTVIQGWNSYAVAYDLGIERPYAHLREYVATSRTDAPEGVTFTADAVSTVRDLKSASGLDILLVGGGQLTGSLLPEIDRLILKRYPVVLGQGIPLFGSAPFEARQFTLTESREFEIGMTMQHYRAARSATS